MNLTVEKKTCKKRLRERGEKIENLKATNRSMRIFSMHASAVCSLFLRVCWDVTKKTKNKTKMMKVLVITASPSL